ncbi:glycosyltransferase family 2 protein [Mucilaginibacter phyllosphaerae]|uniref:Glycosyltransferase family 2 protein n=1 Tax=Mucilaginibacter phyllosphaerae TaxID=1812349 RepID=A0A4Y8AGD7_9SPHI|nr:glycosyltransferase family 2 protein [Mucilaginibacter phyllosphaerae]MBB3968545.1 glycosyltransferase involved in cell wall biosynthesis [Mucilaginibacter phyllosphaerae]TEW67814.1 glycosyltransferase family 2 protein [Mucilaginibacter phyllosphaerae]GGH15350.1 hypothetical protein GCM10007352_24060 [Mucilaginibacter phyllosphaerae]
MMNITFFIPAYNCAQTITEAVKSVMDNAVAGDELVIVNDCSTDDTAAILAHISKNNPVVKIITHKHNKGGAAARNTAVENAEHDLLFCLDADNVLVPKSIDALKKYLTDQQADVASFQYQHFFTTDKLAPAYVWELPAGQYDITRYLKGENAPGQHGNYLFTKQSWINAKGYAEGAGALDTWTFGLRQAISGAKIVVLKDTYYYHRLNHDTSYWMRDAELSLWSSSVKATYALFPFFDLIDEKFLNYMLGKGRYKWFYTLKKKPLKLVSKGAKDNFYAALHIKLNKYLYPKATLAARAINKIKKTYKQ